LYQPSKTIDLTALGVAWTQTPPCQLGVTESYAWTIPAGAVAVAEVAGNPMQLTVYSQKNAEAGTFTVTLVNSIALSSQSFTATPQITFNIEVLDPCATTTFHDVTVNPITMILGATHTQQFTEATTQTEQDNGGLRLCGDRVYDVVDGAGASVSWIAITGANPTYTITATPTDESLIGSTLPYKLKITLADARYSSILKEMALDTTITDATCNCDLLAWDTPSVQT
jgi:hypothetical protein